MVLEEYERFDASGHKKYTETEFWLTVFATIVAISRTFKTLVDVVPTSGDGSQISATL